MSRGLVIALVVIAVLVVGIGAWAVSVNNQLVVLDQSVGEKWAQVQNVYQRRADLIPNLVETVKGFATQERTVLEEVTRARASASSIQLTPEALNDPKALERFQAAQNQLSGALSRRVDPALKLGRGRARLDPLVHRDHRCLEPWRVALLAEARRDRAADDLRGFRVGQRGLEPVSDLEPELSILDEHDEEHAVVETLLPQAPLLEELARDVFQVLALERPEHRDRHLRTGGSLAIDQERFEARTLGGRQQVCVVVQPGGRRRRQDEGDGEDSCEKQTRTSPWGRSPRRAPPRRTPWADNP